MDLGIKGKRALILASSKGLGHGIAVALAREGADVLLCGRSGERLAANCAAINAEGNGKAFWLQADLADPDFVKTLTEGVASKLGGLDILVNNSGGPTPGTTEEMTAENLESYFITMVARVITLTNALLPAMKAQGWGRILTVASSGVIEPLANLALSNTMRPALAGWSKTLASEVASYGVTSNMLLPGSIATDRLDDLDGAAAKRTGRPMEDIRAEKQARIPVGRYGRVDEFAATAAFLCSEPASYITGSMIRCDGGAARSL
ncbi:MULTISPECIES: SDR family oxidoreductase [Rhizobium]|uniref:SDR family oxidoreductase n=1 Tax=Rhizobium rhododendri TaxID=2506430 RepID=A0ABY8IK22_9HYPH|nr:MULTISPECIES: SDR family oxidoreductase [Rhizobium]MBZ5761749.1 SDR family oxidoreductase [Rhizobium sp. VS19-DR96]MBZ5767743.1 SDR family oxidoreductase [Rhizobium sp. VS19-DR129.2]MBZ5773731.1 SDR family oxidoreductase [Rhizobium sp. VS19-DRK62.2]MBZ5786360.1 SDR family oxidoreductase [Rhizobium sp. VS19-DR121]MBZ5802113.1 SDR family oxidoreductase [Rhizobium sp. VS19-DR181]